MASVNGSGEIIKLISVMQLLGVVNFGLKPKLLTKEFNVSTIGSFCKAHARKYVIIVGSNPGKKSPDCSAFHPSTKSRQTIDKWLEGTNYHLIYMNLVDYKTKNNKQLKMSEVNIENVRAKIEPLFKQEDCKIISCGNIASAGLKKAGYGHFEMPHPSGLCRFWNDKEAGDAKIMEMLLWLKN